MTFMNANGSITIGSVCIKTAGREAGEKAVVVEKVDENYVVVQGPKIRKRKCNIAHLFPTGKTVKVTKGVSHKELAKLVEG